MHALRIALVVIWIAFWIYWLASATRAKQMRRGGRAVTSRLAVWMLLIVVLRVARPRSLDIHNLAVGAIGMAIFLGGLALCVWARRNLGRNWGMPMSTNDDPELVTSGPYRRIRHPIYTGLILAFIGTALVTDLLVLIVAFFMGALFVYSAVVEERNMTAALPGEYRAYRARTKMLIPFVL
ncbi:MAG TPA: isoprenylcysteine carboxylmethyltransferase family protein [Solirubrobacteraceae bacterium]|nr:isoprenylcysteine carboxylmethyltransferase family protein [Solirubrobacteraceae bacterium]